MAVGEAKDMKNGETPGNGKGISGFEIINTQGFEELISIAQDHLDPQYYGDGLSGMHKPASAHGCSVCTMAER